MRESAQRIWREITDGEYRFGRTQEEAEAAAAAGRAALLQLHRRHVRPGAEDRACLVVSVSPDPILNHLDNIQCFPLFEVSSFVQ
jgi:hypothetical protein